MHSSLGLVPVYTYSDATTGSERSETSTTAVVHGNIEGILPSLSPSPVIVFNYTKLIILAHKASLKNILVGGFPAVWVLKPPYGRMEFFFFVIFFFFFLNLKKKKKKKKKKIEYSSKLFPAVFFVPM